ncbi:hypothetical protein [Roseisolibacter agri]|uniref:hypothetical protein n=1 Tax=Roseisolibacter agri TaxID=2014610 RepID=UPI0024E06948|nr:hypothetical protein [Roseisolibacter agri]
MPSTKTGAPASDGVAQAVAQAVETVTGKPARIVFNQFVDGELLADLRAVGVPMTGILDTEGPANAEELDGVVVATVPQDAATLDAMASTLLRRMADLDADLAQFKRAHQLEADALKARYERQTAGLTIERGRLEAWVRDLARVQKTRGGFGKKQSRDVGYGTYGVRAIASRLEIADERAFVPWAEQEAPELLRVTVKLPLAEAQQYLTTAELAAVKREVLITPVKEYVERKAAEAKAAEQPAPALPPGIVRTAEELETYAKPAPLAKGGA